MATERVTPVSTTGEFLFPAVNDRLDERIQRHIRDIPAPEPVTSPGLRVISRAEGHPAVPETLAEPIEGDIPVGSFFVSEGDPAGGQFFGHYMSQLLPNNEWMVLKQQMTLDYGKTANEERESARTYNITNLDTYSYLEDVTSFYADVRISNDVAHVRIFIESTGFPEGGGLFGVGLAMPYLTTASGSLVATEYHQYLDINDPKMYSVRYLPASVEDADYNYHDAMRFDISVPGVPESGIIGVQFSFPIDRSYIRLHDFEEDFYVIPANRTYIDAESVLPTLVQAEDYMTGTIIVPDVEGVRYQYAAPRGESEEVSGEVPIVYQDLLDAGINSISVTYFSEPGYVIEGSTPIDKFIQRYQAGFGRPLYVDRDIISFVRSAESSGFNGKTVVNFSPTADSPDFEYEKYEDPFGNDPVKVKLEPGETTIPVFTSITPVAEFPDVPTFTGEKFTGSKISWTVMRDRVQTNGG